MFKTDLGAQPRHLTLRAPANLIKRAKACAAWDGIPVSTLIRKALRQYMETHPCTKRVRESLEIQKQKRIQAPDPGS
jgi:hypothetical protein